MRHPAAVARSMLMALSILVLGILLGLALLWTGQRRIIYLPYREVLSPSAVGLDSARSLVITTEDGIELHAWFVPARTPTVRFTVIVFNGNAGNRSYRAALATAFAERGVATVLFDYRGYGENGGTPSEEGLARDARAVRDHVAASRDMDSTRLVYFGESLGAAVAVRLAVERPPRALILRSPFTSLADVAHHHYPFLPVRWLLRDRYPSVEIVGRVRRPLLVIATDQDEIIPVTQSERLFTAAAEPKRLLRIEAAHHNDFELVAGNRLVDSVVAFVTELDRNQPR